MKIEFDPDKDAANQKKHGLSLAVAAGADFPSAVVRPNSRYAYGDDRFQALGLIEGRLHMLVVTMRGDALRAISRRKANKREVKDYGEKASAAVYRF